MSLTQVDAYSPPETRLFAAQFRKWCIVIGVLWAAMSCSCAPIPSTAR